nr:MAG TPA: hypothetical protein [Caudoviricetes sp.]DAY37773.1 MAG TPA: hypothetical protein [Caudoviricetes sp.]
MQEILSTFRECAILAVRTPRQPLRAAQVSFSHNAQTSRPRT